MIPRVLEPEVMDDRQEATEYDAMDHSQVNRQFVLDLIATGKLSNDCLDLGTGTALIPIELCRAQPEVRVMASDASTSMLELARYNIEVQSLMMRIQLHHGDVKKLNFQNAYFDTVFSNSLVHHLPEPISFFAEACRVLRPSGLLFVRDLCRPETSHEVESLVATYAGSESLHSQQLLRQSLHAALTLEEVRSLVVAVGLPSEGVTMTSDRHWTLIATKVA